MVSFENEVRMRFKSNNFFPDSTGTTVIGDYHVEQIPSRDNSEGLVSFKVAPEEPIFEDSLPWRARREGEYFLSFLSLVSLSNCDFQAGLFDHKNLVPHEIRYTLARKPFNFDLVRESYDKLSTLAPENKRRFVNACKRYRQAISIYDREPIVSFFLLVVAIESLSNKMHLANDDVVWSVYERFHGMSFKKKIRSSVKFVEFICRYLPPNILNDEGNIELLKLRLLSAYSIRNWFVHDGEDLPTPVVVADQCKARSLVCKIVKNGKEYEIRAPALLWLEKIVVNTLMGFLSSESGKSESTSVFRDLAEKSGVYKMNLREGHPTIPKGQVIDIEFIKKWVEMDP